MPEKQTIQKNDFIEIEFTGRNSSNNQIFDTTNPEEAKEMGIQEPQNIKPQIISIGNDMLLKGLDQALLNKELNKEYKIELTPEKAFGKRNPQMIKTYSLSHFKKNNMDPYPGMTLQLDNTIAKVISVSGGRVMMDFNNPLAGKEVNYTFKITRKITDNSEKINAIQDFFLKQRYNFTIDKKNKKVIFKEKLIKPFFEMMGQKLKDMTGFEFVVEEEKTEKKEKPQEEPGNKQD